MSILSYFRLIIENMVLQYEKKRNSTTLTTLCVLSILGNAFLILKGIISLLILIDSNDTRSEETIFYINLAFFIEFLTCFGSVAGAILMLMGKKVGLIIQLVSGITYLIITAIYAFFCFILIIGIIVGLFQLVYMGITVLFLILFLGEKKHLS